MKQAPAIAKTARNLRPGVLSRDGFLGDDPRELAAILDADANTVQRLGLTHERIAARLRFFREAAAAGLGEPVTVAPHFEATVESYPGKLACPFGHRGTVRKVNITVRNTTLGAEARFTDLCIHLIEAHGFYQGRGATYRNDPEELARVLEIAPEA